MVKNSLERAHKELYQLVCALVALPVYELYKQRQHFDDTMDAVALLKSEGYEVLSIEQCEGSIALQSFSVQAGKRYAIIMGNEVKGVQQQVVDASDGAIEIPQFGTKHSLNVSVTAGMVIWEFAKKFGWV